MYKMPAFIDSHMHFLGMGYVAHLIDLKPYESIEKMIESIKNMPQTDRIIGRGWNQERFIEKRSLTKQDLNRISDTLPVVMVRTCGHVLAVNDSMLKLANIGKDTLYAGTGSIDFETGLISEDAINLIYQAYPKPLKSDLKKYLIKADEICLANGVTSVASDDFQIFNVPFETIIDVINECYEEDLIHVRITEQANLRTLPELKRFIDNGYVNRHYPKFKLGPLKLLVDGSLGGRTALLREPYADDPLNIGIRSYANSDLFALIHLADRSGMDCVIHAIGDAAIDQALDALIASLKITKRTHHRHAIIHAQLADFGHIQRMKAYNIGAIVQPIFLNSDIEFVKARIGARSKEAYLFHSMWKEGLKVGFSTDAPIELVNPFHNLYCALSRKSIIRPDLPVYLKEERFSIAEALECYNGMNLFYTYEQKNLGSIILSADPMTSSDENLLNIEVLETFIEGRSVYRKS